MPARFVPMRPQPIFLHETKASPNPKLAPTCVVACAVPIEDEQQSANRPATPVHAATGCQNRIVKWTENARKRKQETEELRDRALASVEASTLSYESRPFTQVKVIWGTSSSSMEGAYEALLTEAYNLGCDAVLGVGFTSPPHPTPRQAGEIGAGHPSVNFVAYGTGVVWTSEGSADH